MLSEPAATLFADRATVWRRFLRNRVAVAAVIVLAILSVAAVFAPWLAPHDPNRQVLVDRLASPSRDRLLGTDILGRDILSRLIYGSRVSMIAGLEAVTIGVFLGLPLGLFAGVGKRWIDTILTTVFDGVVSIPGIVLALAIIAGLGAGLTKAMIAIGVVLSPRFFRLARSASRELNVEPFVESAVVIGSSKLRILIRHILPSSLPALSIQVSFSFAVAILAEASLSFLGLGVSPPTASWGGMLSDASRRPEVTHLIVGPGVILTLTLLALSLIGDGWSDALGLDRDDPER